MANVKAHIKLDHCCNVGCTAEIVLSEDDFNSIESHQNEFQGHVFMVEKTNEPAAWKMKYHHV